MNADQYTIVEWFGVLITGVGILFITSIFALIILTKLDRWE